MNLPKQKEEEEEELGNSTVKMLVIIQTIVKWHDTNPTKLFLN